LDFSGISRFSLKSSGFLDEEGFLRMMLISPVDLSFLLG